jgi:uncharacterized protein YjbJ (UPF0337 family)
MRHIVVPPIDSGDLSNRHGLSPRAAKGRLKEAAGVMTNDERLKQEGKVDQALGKIKQATEKVVNKVRDAVKGD